VRLGLSRLRGKRGNCKRMFYSSSSNERSVVFFFAFFLLLGLSSVASVFAGLFLGGFEPTETIFDPGLATSFSVSLSKISTGSISTILAAGASLPRNFASSVSDIPAPTSTTCGASSVGPSLELAFAALSVAFSSSDGCCSLLRKFGV
jgi:hypothetical protein